MKKRIRRRKVLRAICVCIGIIGFVVAVGATGGIECETLSFKAGVIQMLVGALLMFCGIRVYERIDRRF